MHRLVLICSVGFLLAGMIPRMASASPLTFVRDRVQDEADEAAVIEENEIDRDVVVAPPVVLTQTRQPSKGKNKFKVSLRNTEKKKKILNYSITQYEIIFHYFKFFIIP